MMQYGTQYIISFLIDPGSSIHTKCTDSEDAGNSEDAGDSDDSDKGESESDFNEVTINSGAQSNCIGQ